MVGFVATLAGSAPAAVINWTGTGTDILWSNPLNWSSGSPPGPSTNVQFINDGSAGSPIALGGAVNNVVDAGFTGSINSLIYRNIVGFHNTSLANPLVVLSDSATDVAFISDDAQPAIMFVGSANADGANDSVYASITGTTMLVSNGNANLSVMQASVTSGSHRATLDLTGLSSFTCVVSNVLVGHDFGVPITRPTGTLILGLNNSITASLISVGEAYQNAGAISYIYLGQANALNVDRIRVALHKCLGTVAFAPGLSAPTVTFRAADGTGRQRSWEIGDEYEPDQTIGYFTSSQSTGILDLSGGSVDAMVDRITLGRGQTNAPTRTGDGNGTLTFDSGTINANSLEMGIQLSDGGSTGRGTLNVNTRSLAPPASITVNGNLVMAQQYAANTDASGATAVINLNGGTLNVGGSILDGKGLSTINIDNGGKLDLMPNGDTTPGDISVDVLNLISGSLVDYATLSVSNIFLGPTMTSFDMLAGQTLAPLGVGTIGTLPINGDLNSHGTLDMDISKVDGVLSSDTIALTGVADLSGALRVRFSGNNPLARGDRFKLIDAPFLFDTLTMLSLPTLPPGLDWTNNFASDGTIEVVSSGEPPVPPTLMAVTTPTNIVLSWPPAYTSYSLRGQTNPLTIGLSNNWGRVTGVVGNKITIPIDLNNGTVFFQLIKEP
jgi:hypothetical protein